MTGVQTCALPICDHWLAAMRHAITVARPSPEVEAEIERYIAMAAEAMRNR